MDIFDDLKCGQGVKQECLGITVNMTIDGFKLLTSEVVSIANFLLQGAA